jgi:hypothetical protein
MPSARKYRTHHAKKGDAVLAAQFLDARAIDRTNVYLMANQAIGYALANDLLKRSTPQRGLCRRGTKCRWFHDP